jgi:protein transport protein SEC23
MGDNWEERSLEDSDGVRLSWNVWPSTRLEATKMVVPCGLLYTPLKQIEHMPGAVPYEPIRCKGCGAVLNPYCQVDFRSKLWTCPFCFSRNHFPQHYAENITESNLPAELISAYSTLEYQLPTRVEGPPIFLFCVDTCIMEEEIDELKDSLQQTLNLLPENALVGLITFGMMVNVHELGFSECPKAYVFRGTKDVTAQQVQDLLGIKAAAHAICLASRWGGAFKDMTSQERAPMCFMSGMANFPLHARRMHSSITTQLPTGRVLKSDTSAGMGTKQTK